MATSKCVKCDNTSFEMVENAPSGSRFKVMFIQCNRCGCVIGVTDYNNTSSELADITKKLNEFSTKMNQHLTSLDLNVHIVDGHVSQVLNTITTRLPEK